MNKTYTVTIEEFIEGSLLKATPLRTWLLWGLAFGAVIAAINLFSMGLNWLDLAVAVGIGLASAVAYGLLMWLFMRLVCAPIQLRRHYRHNRFFFEDATLATDETGFTSAGQRGSAQFKWSEVRELKESRRTYVIDINPTLGFIVSKSALNAEECAELVRLAGSRRQR